MENPDLKNVSWKIPTGVVFADATAVGFSSKMRFFFFGYVFAETAHRWCNSFLTGLAFLAGGM